MHLPVAPAHLAALVRAGDAVLRSSTRFAVEDPAGLIDRVRSGEPVIFVCRHGQLWPVLWSVRGTGTRVLVSRSPDGELLAQLLEGWGFHVSRGSSSRDGMTGARDALRALRDGRTVGLAVDGPRGPRAEVQEGCVRLARRADVPLVPLRATGGTWTLRRTWDHFEIPRPAGNILVEAGPEVRVGPGRDGIARACRELFEALSEEPSVAPGPAETVSATGPRP
jgi:lysophospholipid acyltransferase (LPLAT)-like uncharacterized protein